MNTPTPRTDAAVKLTFAAGHNTVCPNFARTLERELTALTAERDQLRAEVERLTKQAVFDGDHIHTLNAAFATRAEVTDANARAEKAEAQLHALRLVCGTTDANKFETWTDRANARAERAEAAETVALANWNGALERALKAEAERATERARLDWLETPSGMDWQWEPERLTVSRASIDAAMKEDAK